MEVFKAVVAKAQLLENEIGKYFAPVGEGSNSRVLRRQFSKCGNCGRKMDLKVGPCMISSYSPLWPSFTDRWCKQVDDEGDRPKHFLFCDRCRKAHKLPHNRDFAPIDFDCPICQ